MNGDDQSDNVCRDFLRNVCKRGDSCKFRHPAASETARTSSGTIEFCHDFQNPGGCRRTNCRFAHCTREEEATYRETGQLPAHLQNSTAGQPASSTSGETPVCKDFMYGHCDRGRYCKYRHVTQSEYDYSALAAAQCSYAATAAAAAAYGEQVAAAEYYQARDHYGEDLATKRRRVEAFEQYGVTDPTAAAAATAYAADSAYYSHIALLQQRNAELEMRVREMEKQVENLRAVNEVLLEQNARYRSPGQPGAALGMPLANAAPPVSSIQGSLSQGVVADAAALVTQRGDVLPVSVTSLAQNLSLPAALSAAVSSSGLVSYPIQSHR